MRKGFEGLQFDGRVAFRQSIINSEIHRVIEQRLTSPKATFTPYAELINWIIENYISEGIYCHTINKYVKRHFGTKLKVSRKRHL